MKKIVIISVLALSLFNACTKEELDRPIITGDGDFVQMTFKAITTKTVLNSDRSVSFAAGEQIAVFANGNRYCFTTTSGGTNAEFTGTVAAVDAGATTFYAVSPYSATANTSTVEEGAITNLTIAKGSAWAATGTYAPEKAVAAAITTGSTFEFRQACALLKFSVPASVTDLTQIVIFNRDAGISGSLSGTFSVTPHSGSAPTVTVTAAEGNPHQTGATFTDNEAFAAGTYYIPVLPATLTSGVDIKTTFSDGFNGRKFNTTAVTLVAGSVYDLGTITKSGFLFNTFENNNLDGEYSGNAGALSLVENPLKTATNPSNYVLRDDMHTAGSTTSGYWQTASGETFSSKFPSSMRSRCTIIRMKMYWGSDKYYPRFLFNKSGSAIRPLKVNNVTIGDDQAVFDSAIKTDDWNILEWQSTQFLNGETPRSNLSGLSTFQVRMFVNWSNTNLAPDGENYHHIAYIDDIEFM